MRALLAGLLLAASPAAAVTCEDITFEGTSFTACTVDATTEDLRLFHRDAAGEVLGTFSNIETAIAPRTLAFGMNAGMYHEDRRAVGLYIQDGVQTAGIVTSDGPGNFGLLPNGLLCLTDDSARVIESLAYVATEPDCRDASQSGPMLVIDGALHPDFIPNSDSLNIRNGVGTSGDGTRAVFAIANQPVNFHTFARFFRDRMETPDALYFDGRVSRMLAPQLGRNDFGLPMGPMVGVVE
ncbi:phosphodiester glycosidase family protein [Loktanella sp. TSTF-M6]|uniref:Phosphodiester glycosidase family protein n=1 Tax=Loktanella gaetbuli TaxID=2881335 RepID=A0ABS8BV40_9RHOB|nr:phosphodiester glycosidase family protein [Loktanella gaetbuli]MCB5199381.1 phosphodiester glycosidase family protein [Loktanella gaetbuli]